MKKHIAYILSTVLLGAMGFNSSTSSQSQTSSQAAADFSQLTLRIRSTKDSFIQLEPVPIILELRNETSEPIEGHSAIGISQNYIKLFVSGHGAEMREIKDLSLHRKLVVASPQTLAPGQQFQSKQILALNLEDIFPRPGTYRLRVTLTNDKGKKEVTSNNLTIHVLEPQGSDQQAFDYIKSKGTPSNFFYEVNLPNSKNTADVLEEFVYNFSGSAYGDYAIFLLGEFYLANKDYVKAQEKFTRIAERADFLFADKAKDLLTTAKEKSDKLGKSN